MTQIGERTIRAAIAAGELRALKIGSRGRIVIPVAALLQWLDERSREPKSAAR